jgi:hypothetical protein
MLCCQTTANPTLLFADSLQTFARPLADVGPISHVRGNIFERPDSPDGRSSAAFVADFANRDLTDPSLSIRPADGPPSAIAVAHESVGH